MTTPAPVRRVVDLPYREESADPAFARCRLDLTLPAGTGWPLLVWFHGGGLRDGTREWTRGLADALAGRGVGTAAASYRLHPVARYPAYLDDAAAAVAWSLRAAQRHGADPRRVLAGGHSAGAWLAAMVGLDPSRLAAHGASPAQLAGVIPVSGQMITHFTVREERGIPASRIVADEASPLAHARGDAPPFLFLAADGDLPPRPEENRYLAATLRMLGGQAEYVEIAGRDHGSIMDRAVAAGDPCLEAIVAFALAKHAP